MDQTNIGFFNFAEQGFSLPIENYDSDSYSSIDQVFLSYPPASEASRKVANLNERKINIPTYMVSKNFSVCLSVCLLPNLTPIISGQAKQNPHNPVNGVKEFVCLSICPTICYNVCLLKKC